MILFALEVEVFPWSTTDILFSYSQLSTELVYVRLSNIEPNPN